MTPTPATLPRLLLFTDNFDRGGSQAQLVHLVNTLAATSGYEVHVGCLRRGGPLLQRLQLPPQRIREFRLRRFYDATGLRAIARLASYVARRRFAVVHAQDFYANVMCTAACAWLPGVKLVVSRRYEVRSNRPVHQWGERWCYRLADVVMLNSHRIAANLVQTGVVPPAKVAVVPNGIDPASYRDAPRAAQHLRATDPCRVGIVARLAPVKGHAVLLEAVARLAPRWPGLEVVFIGEGELRPALSARAAQLQVQDRLQIVGDQPDVRPWLATLDVAVLPSWHEGLPNALLEYFATGCPVVASDVGGIRDVADERNAVLVPPGDPEQLAGAIDALLRDPARRTALGAAARARALNFTVDRMVAGTCALYERLLDGGRQSRLGTHLAAALRQRTPDSLP